MLEIPQIRPVSDLRNKFSDISRSVHETNTPVFFNQKWPGGHARVTVTNIS
jgi:hypothetical protein